MGSKPEADWAVEAPIVAELLRQQAPAYAELELRPLASGWDNDTFLLGSEKEKGARFVARLPRRQIAVPLIENEHRWLARLPALPLPIPIPIVRGTPIAAFPRPWSLCPFFEGEASTTALSSDPQVTAERLGTFLSALHVAAPPDAPDNPFRSVALAERDALFETHITELTDIVDEGQMRDAWHGFRALPSAPTAVTWLHGDMHPSNLIVDDGSLTAVIDFGDLCSGDRATDLSAGWMMFETDARERFRQAANADEATWQRARGWAFSRAVVFAATAGNDPAFRQMALSTIEHTTGIRVGPY